MTPFNPYDPDKAEFEALAQQYKALGHKLSRLYDLRTGRFAYTASRWGYAKPLKSLKEVRSFLKLIGGAHAGH